MAKPLFNATFRELIAAHPDRLATRVMHVGPGVLAHTPALLVPHLPDGRWMIVDDRRTGAVAGTAVRAALAAAGRDSAHLSLAEHGTPADLHADHEQVERLESALRRSGAVAAIAVGSGTVNDVVKMAAHRVGLPCAVVATAPSMNGYTSSIAAILDHGVKTTQPCLAPRVVIGDLDVLAAAPAAMIAAGYADLLSKPVSNSDWLLAHRLLGSTWSADTLALIERGSAWLDGIADRLPRREPAAVEALMASLLVSGVAMTLAGSSAPASGGEHLISHYLDMTDAALGEGSTLHGLQVGVGTLVAAELYERVLALPAAAIDPDARAAAWPTWAQAEPGIAAAFGPLAEQVLPHARAAHPEPAELHARLSALRALWPTLREELRATGQPVATIRANLVAAGCPVSFAGIGVAPERAARAMNLARHVRARYTILHLAAELGIAPAAP